MLTQLSSEEISHVNDSSMLTLLKYSAPFDEVIWALSWEAESVADEIGANTKTRYNFICPGLIAVSASSF